LTQHAHLLLQLGGMLHTAPGLVPGVDEPPRSLTGVRLLVPARLPASTATPRFALPIALGPALWLATDTPRCEPLMSARRHSARESYCRTEHRRTKFLKPDARRCRTCHLTCHRPASCRRRL
jgi:hypothetical protein